MGKSSTISKNKYNSKSYDRLNVLVFKGQRELIKSYANTKGMSLNSYINSLIVNDMGNVLYVPNLKENEV